MKKVIFSFILMLSCMMTYAQTTVEGSKPLDNTTVSVYGGGMGWLQPAVVNEEKFLDGVRPSFGIALGKWFTPAVGLEVFYENSFGSLPYNTEVDRHTVLDFMNIGLNAQVNLNNIFHHYKGHADLVEVVPFAGLGWGHGWTTQGGSNLYAPQNDDHYTDFLTANTGVKINFNLGQKQAWQINVIPSIHYMLAGEYLPVQFNKDKAYVALQAGVTYKFGHKNSKGERVHNFALGYNQAQYDTLLDELNQLRAQEPTTITKVVEKVVEKTVEVEKVVYVNPDPRFPQKVAVVDATSVSVLDALAEEMKANDAEYQITGYASVEGDEAYNQALSEKRAEAVADYLKSKGVSADRLHVTGAGETDQFGDNYDANRRVVVTKL